MRAATLAIAVICTITVGFVEPAIMAAAQEPVVAPVQAVDPDRAARDARSARVLANAREVEKNAREAENAAREAERPARAADRIARAADRIARAVEYVEQVRRENLEAEHTEQVRRQNLEAEHTEQGSPEEWKQPAQQQWQQPQPWKQPQQQQQQQQQPFGHPGRQPQLQGPSPFVNRMNAETEANNNRVRAKIAEISNFSTRMRAEQQAAHDRNRAAQPEFKFTPPKQDHSPFGAPVRPEDFPRRR